MRINPNHVAASAIGLALATLLFFVSMVIVQTMWPQNVPLKFEPGVASAYPTGDVTIVLYTRAITPESDVDFVLDRTIDCEHAGGRYVHDLDPMSRQAKQGQIIKPTRVLVYPIALPVGTKCVLTSAVKWSPLMAMNWHFLPLPPITFDVGPQP